MKNRDIIKYSMRVFIAFLTVYYLQSSTLARIIWIEEEYSQFQFNFITPGARATAMGGAFIGLADDATAAESNPAGLSQLVNSEVSGELKYITYITGPMLENLFSDTIRRNKVNNSVVSIPFLSAVWPYKRFVFSAYYQELVNYKSSYRTGANSIFIPGTSRYYPPIETSLDTTIINYGVGFTVQLFDQLSLAVSPRWSHLIMRTDTALFRGPITDFSDSDIQFRGIDNYEYAGISLNTGLLWHLHPRISLGAVYKSGATIDWGGGEDSIRLKVPDSYGGGFAIRATDVLTCTFDVVYIQYQDFLKDSDIVFYTINSSNQNKDYTMDNVTEFHVGVEYVLLDQKRPLALRAGLYYEPEHTIHFTGTTGDPEIDIFSRTLFPKGEDLWHYTGGLGLVLNENSQVDIAADIAENKKQFSLSAVYRF